MRMLLAVSAGLALIAPPAAHAQIPVCDIEAVRDLTTVNAAAVIHIFRDATRTSAWRPDGGVLVKQVRRYAQSAHLRATLFGPDPLPPPGFAGRPTLTWRGPVEGTNSIDGWFRQTEIRVWLPFQEWAESGRGFFTYLDDDSGHILPEHHQNAALTIDFSDCTYHLTIHDGFQSTVYLRPGDGPRLPSLTYAEDYGIRVSGPIRALSTSIHAEGSRTFESDGLWPATHNFVGSVTVNQEWVVSREVVSSGFSRCRPGREWHNVMAPPVGHNLPLSVKPWNVEYDELPLTMRLQAPSGEGHMCEAVSNAGSFQASLQPGVLGTGFPGYREPVADATGVARLTVYEPAALAAPPTCDFDPAGGAVTNECIFDTAFDPSRHYLGWRTEGFSVRPAGSDGPPRISGPLSFYVDLEELGVSPAIVTMEVVLRRGEAHVHRRLVESLPFVALPAVMFIQDPGRASVLVTSEEGASTGIRRGGTPVTEIPSSFYYQSLDDPAVILLDFPDASYDVVLTTHEDGPFQLGVSTVSEHGVAEAALSGNAAAGVSLAYHAVTASGTGGMPLLDARPAESLHLAVRHIQTAPATRNARLRRLILEIDGARAALLDGSSALAVERVNNARTLIGRWRGKRLSTSAADRLWSWLGAVLAQIADAGAGQTTSSRRARTGMLRDIRHLPAG